MTIKDYYFNFKFWFFIFSLLSIFSLMSNAHLTALIFNYNHHLKALNTLNTNYKYLNLYFLRLQPKCKHMVLLFYLYKFFISKKNFIF